MKIKEISDNSFIFSCPGCKQPHRFTSSWQFNGDLENPTINPSILVKSGHFAPHFKEGDNCWCSYNLMKMAEGLPESKFRCAICHSFIKEGKIQFLGDCTHELVGQTVELPEID